MTRSNRPNERRIEIWHADPCGCTIDGAAIYVHEPCLVIGHHVTKRRVSQLIHTLRQSKDSR